MDDNARESNYDLSVLPPDGPSARPILSLASAEPALIRRSSGVDQSRRLSLLEIFVIDFPYACDLITEAGANG